MEETENGKVIESYSMSEFLRGQASKIITAISNEDKTGIVMKHDKPVAVIISNERYERLLEAGIDIKNY